MSFTLKTCDVMTKVSLTASTCS